MPKRPKTLSKADAEATSLARLRRELGREPTSAETAEWLANFRKGWRTADKGVKKVLSRTSGRIK